MNFVAILLRSNVRNVSLAKDVDFKSGFWGGVLIVLKFKGFKREDVPISISINSFNEFHCVSYFSPNLNIPTTTICWWLIVLSIVKLRRAGNLNRMNKISKRLWTTWGIFVRFCSKIHKIYLNFQLRFHLRFRNIKCTCPDESLMLRKFIYVYIYNAPKYHATDSYWSIYYPRTRFINRQGNTAGVNIWYIISLFRTIGKTRVLRLFFFAFYRSR